MDFRGFKKIAEDAKSSTMAHPSGHKLVIVHASLSPKMKKALKSLPLHLAEGGEATASPDPEAPAPDASREPQSTPQAPQAPVVVNVNSVPQPQDPPSYLETLHEQYKNGLPYALGTAARNAVADTGQAFGKVAGAVASPVKKFAQGLAGATPDDAAATPDNVIPLRPKDASTSNLLASNAPAVPATPPPAPPEDPFLQSMDAQGAATMKGANERKAGLMAEANALGAQGRDEAAAADQQQMHLKNLQDNYQKQYDSLNSELVNLKKDYQEGHIDPNHWWNSKSTGGKIAASIGVLLGGIGGGLQGTGRNPALDFANEQINRDIDAQKEDLGKKRTLLEANFRQFGNLKDATDMTRVMMMEGYKAQLEKAVGMNAAPLAKARAQAAIGAIDQEIAPIMGQMAMRRAMVKVSKQMGQGAGDQMGQYLTYLRMTNPKMAEEMEKRYVPGVGVASIPVPDKARETIIARQNLDQAVSDLESFADKHAGTILDRATINEGAAKARLVQDAYRRANGQGVFREGEAKFVNSLLDDDPTKFGKWRTLPGYQAVREGNRSELQGLYKNYGLNAAAGQPAAPATPQVKTYRGAQYVKVNGGWKRVMNAGS